MGLTIGPKYAILYIGSSGYVHSGYCPLTFRWRSIMRAILTLVAAVTLTACATNSSNRAVVSMSRQDVVGPVLATKTTTVETKHADGSTTVTKTTESTNMSSAAADHDLKKKGMDVVRAISVANSTARSNTSNSNCSPLYGCGGGGGFGGGVISIGGIGAFGGINTCQNAGGCRNAEGNLVPRGAEVTWGGSGVNVHRR